MHAQYETWGKEHEVTDAKKFGEGMALCVGDIAIFGAFSHLAGLTLPPIVHKRILTLMLKEFLTVGFGELHDTALGYIPTMPTPDEVLSMYRKKTARYTFSLPFVTACILTEQNDETQLAMSELGQALGSIFQLRDDELTLVGKEEVVGKTIGNDIMENKKTYATTLLWEHVTPEEKRELEHIFGNASIETKDIIFVQSLFSKYNISALIFTLMMEYEKTANTIITTLNLPEIKKDELRAITHYLATREK